MEIATAQRDVRTTFAGGSAGQLVSGLIWALSASCATWQSHALGMWVLVLGGCFIFPLTQLTLRLSGRPASLPKGHPMNALGMQVAFVVPLCLPLVYAATVAHEGWFYPSLLILVGAHYLPFIFMYGMPQFGVLAGLMLVTGVLLPLLVRGHFVLGGWLGAALLLVFAALGRAAVRAAPRS